ncbi:hypothetical protein [Runella sp.]|uniref:hypothetical protein n=1 Tax=Runella sp. TaxID=1960881 RepID=UPI003D126397
MRISLLLLFGLPGIINVAISQTTNPVPKQPMWMDGAYTGHDFRYEGFRGSALFINEWLNGQVSLTDGRLFKDVPLKYNAYTKRLFMKNPVGDSIEVFSNLMDSFVINDPVSKNDFVFKRFPTAKMAKNNAGDLFFLVLYEGKTSLVKLINKTIKKADYKDPYSNNIPYDTFEDAHEYYLLKPDNTLTKVKKSKKAITEALSDKEPAVKDFMVQQNVTVKTEAELVRVVAKYDSF